MSADDREARRLAVEAAAREWVAASEPGRINAPIIETLARLRAAVRRLDAPRFQIVQGNQVEWVGPTYRQYVATCHKWHDGVRLWQPEENAERIAALLNDAEGR